MKNTGLKLFYGSAQIAHLLSRQTQHQPLFTNVDIFNGTKQAFMKVSCSRWRLNLIKPNLQQAPEAGEAVVIDGEGKTLPGLIEGHGHLLLNGGNPERSWKQPYDWRASGSFNGFNTKRNAFNRAFTTWRDAGGLNTGLRKTIDSGMIAHVFTRRVPLLAQRDLTPFLVTNTANNIFFGSTTSMARNSVSF